MYQTQLHSLFTIFTCPKQKGNEYKLYILVHLTQSCPHGFHISKSEKLCVCEPRWHNTLAYINAVYTNQHIWVGYDQFHGLILNPVCPFEYCVNHTVVFTLNNTDIQCAYNRSGLLCGHQKEGYSLVLSTSHCRKCTNFYLVLLIPFALLE